MYLLQRGAVKVYIRLTLIHWQLYCSFSSCLYFSLSFNFMSLHSNSVPTTGLWKYTRKSVGKDMFQTPIWMKGVFPRRLFYVLFFFYEIPTPCPNPPKNHYVQNILLIQTTLKIGGLFNHQSLKLNFGFRPQKLILSLLQHLVSDTTNVR